jgi:predicted MFS family arabinose efflux permease
MAIQPTEPENNIKLEGSSNASIHGQVVLFTATRTVTHTAYRMVYPFLNVFARGLGIDLVTLSLVLTVRSLSGLLGPFLAPIADLRGRKVSMLMGLGLSIGGCLLVTFFPTYPIFFISMIAIALGSLIFIPALQAYIGDRVAYQQRGRVIGITELSWSLSFVVGVPLVGWLIDTLSKSPETSGLAWRAPFPFLAALGLIFMVLIIWRIPNNLSKTPAIGNGLQTVRHILAVPAVILGLGFATSSAFANELVNLVFGIWLEDQFGLKLAALGAASAVIGLSELSGEGLSALITDRLGKERSIRLGLTVSAISTILLYLLGGRSVFGALFSLFFFYLGFEFTVVSSLPLMSEIYPSARATVMAATVASFSLGRAFAGALAARFYEQNFLWNLGVALMFNAVAFLLISKVKIKHTDSDHS